MLRAQRGRWNWAGQQRTDQKGPYTRWGIWVCCFVALNSLIVNDIHSFVYSFIHLLNQRLVSISKVPTPEKKWVRKNSEEARGGPLCGSSWSNKDTEPSVSSTELHSSFEAQPGLPTPPPDLFSSCSWVGGKWPGILIILGPWMARWGHHSLSHQLEQD